jgi:hypothetical protein
MQENQEIRIGGCERYSMQKKEHFCSNPEHEMKFAESTETGQLFCTICKAPFKEHQIA